MARQEKGIKQSCALPYELYADGKLNADKTAFEMKLSAGNKVFGDKAVGAPLNVYAPGRYRKRDSGEFENVRTWSYGITAGDSLDDSWPLSEFEGKNYHLKVYGPNGFYRGFKGNAADPDIHIGFNYQRGLTDSKKLTGNVELLLSNLSKKSIEVEITDHSYKTNNYRKTIPPNGKVTLPLTLQKSYGWYDFSVKLAGHRDFEKRYAGRVETGRASYSDPFMGQVV